MTPEKMDNPTVQHTPTEPPVPSPADIAPLFPQLEIVEILGWGGMGVVYKARQRHLDRLIAVKLLLPKPGRDDAFAERFAREARALARLQHPNIVAVFDFGMAGDYSYLLMEFVDGANLRQMMADGPVNPALALSIVPQVCDALQFAHDEGVLHRDIKPENILVDRHGRSRIADFGLAKLTGERHTDIALTAPQQVMGTMHYMAPEQIESSSAVDHRADLYALGVVLYELLTGELPIGRFPLPSESGHGDAHMDEIILRALEKQPDRRYQSASEIKTALESGSRADAMVNEAVGRAMHIKRKVEGGSSAWSRFGQAPQQTEPMPVYVNQRFTGIAYLLWLLMFAGACGIHRMYAGKWITGIVWFLTFGLLSIGQFIDLLLIPGMIKHANLVSRYEAEITHVRRSSGHG